MLQPIHLYNLEPIICGSKKVPWSALLKFRNLIVNLKQKYEPKTFVKTKI